MEVQRAALEATAGSRSYSRLYRAFNDLQRLEMAIFEQGSINMVGNRSEEV
ncbi:hypothetical protein SLEP1_g12564 [Rubroshorea leprosula]|uniref:Uncharacterized protein n=1 Tax=Rubroshorea leprosula TaxID=152421 RepID=A0AAV5IPB6_9ROSI|nr:hypothetical protein SLEP1_g12564 [Rubroshorea leprosula]